MRNNIVSWVSMTDLVVAVALAHTDIVGAIDLLADPALPRPDGALLGDKMSFRQGLYKV